MGFWPGYLLFCSFLVCCKGLHMRHKKKVFLRPSTNFEHVRQRKQLLEGDREKLVRLLQQEQSLVAKKQEAQRKAVSKLAAARFKVPQPSPAKLAKVQQALSKAQNELHTKLLRIQELERVIGWTDGQIESLAQVLRNVEQRAKNMPMLYGD